jgi:hypothetical protein
VRGIGWRRSRSGNRRTSARRREGRAILPPLGGAAPLSRPAATAPPRRICAGRPTEPRPNIGELGAPLAHTGLVPEFRLALGNHLLAGARPRRIRGRAQDRGSGLGLGERPGHLALLRFIGVESPELAARHRLRKGRIGADAPGAAAPWPLSRPTSTCGQVNCGQGRPPCLNRGEKAAPPRALVPCVPATIRSSPGCYWPCMGSPTEAIGPPCGC